MQEKLAIIGSILFLLIEFSFNYTITISFFVSGKLKDILLNSNSVQSNSLQLDTTTTNKIHKYSFIAYEKDKIQIVTDITTPTTTIIGYFYNHNNYIKFDSEKIIFSGGELSENQIDCSAKYPDLECPNNDCTYNELTNQNTGNGEYTFTYIFKYNILTPVIKIIRPQGDGSVVYKKTFYLQIKQVEAQESGLTIKITNLPVEPLVEESTQEQLLLDVEYPSQLKYNYIFNTSKGPYSEDLAYDVYKSTKKVLSLKIRFILCDFSCETCSGEVEDIVNKKYCKTCITGYAFLDNIEERCVKDKPQGHYLTQENSFNIYAKCYKKCKECQQGGDENNNNCDSCIYNVPSLYYSSFHGGNCYFYEEIPSGFCLESNREKIVLCPQSSSEFFTMTTISEEELNKKAEDDIISFLQPKTTYRGKNFMLQVYSTDDPIKENDIVSSFKLSKQCEEMIKKENKIPIEEPIIIKKCDYNINDNTLPVNNVKYSLFSKNGKKLDINICNDKSSVTISSPIHKNFVKKYDFGKIVLEKNGYDIFNPNDEFYNNICTPYYAEYGDVIIKDRRNYIFPNISFCKENCEYKNINYESAKAVCECDILTEEKQENSLYPKEFFSQAIDSTNLGIVVCYEYFYDYKEYLGNYGCYIIMPLFVIQLILNCAFYCKELRTIIGHFNRHSNFLTPTTKLSNATINTKDTFTLMTITSPSQIYKSTKSLNDEKKKEDEEDGDDDFNGMHYVKAKRLDKRNCLKMFFSLLTEKLELFSIIFFPGEYNGRCYALSIYILSFVVELTLNAMLFSDDVISTKYHNQGETSKYVTFFLSLSSNFLSYLFTFLINKLSSFSDAFELFINEKKTGYLFIKKFSHLVNVAKFKIKIFFLFQFCLMIFCLYYIIIFCHLYKETQKNWLTDSITSIIISLITAFLVSILIAILRSVSLCLKSKNLFYFSRYIYQNA